MGGGSSLKDSSFGAVSEQKAHYGEIAAERHKRNSGVAPASFNHSAVIAG